MAGEVEAYLQAYNAAQNARVEISLAADLIERFANSMRLEAQYQTVPPDFPTPKQLEDMLKRYRTAIEKARSLHAGVPAQYKPRIPDPDRLERGSKEKVPRAAAESTNA